MDAVLTWILRQFDCQFRSPELGSVSGWLAMKLMEGNAPSIVEGIGRMELQSSDTFVELGAGHGIGLQHILMQNDESKIPKDIHCIEISPEFRSKLHEQLAQLQQEHRVSIHSNDCRDMDFLENDSVDKIFSMNVVYFLDPLDVYLKEIHRVLKPQGGVVVFGCKFTLLPKDSNVFINVDEELIVESMKKAGFDVTITNVHREDKTAADYTEIRGVKKTQSVQ